MLSIRYYGWPMVGLGFLFYGLGIAPAYYSWGFFAPEIIADLDLTRQQVGEIFGAFALMLSISSMVSSTLINRWGVRVTVTLGAVLASLGWLLVSQANSVSQLYISYALIGGLGIGLSTLIPAQTLAVFWFRRYRARAIAIIFFGAAFFGAIVTPIDAYILIVADWRVAWVYISLVSFLIAIVCASFLRDKPEDVGQQCDGDSIQDKRLFEPIKSEGKARSMTVRQAISTPQFFFATFADVANAVPWRIITAHGRLHMESLGFAPSLAAAILGVRVGMSGLGRLTGSLGDFVSPRYIMALALLFTASGVGGFWFAKTSFVAYVCVALMGVGYGAAFTTIPVIFGNLFGREPFVGIAGFRVAITGLVGFYGVSWAGAAADRSGNYDRVLVILALICTVASVLILLCKKSKLEE